MVSARMKYLPLIAMLLIACVDLPAQSQSKSDNNGTTLSDDKIYQEAAIWFKKAEEMIGTPKENSDEQAHEKVIALGKAEPLNYFHLGILYAAANQPDPAIEAFAQAIALEPEKYRSILKDELKQVHSKLDSVRYNKKFVSLLDLPPTK
jgi:tetratricopeptide (TPR) repeat protein